MLSGDLIDADPVRDRLLDTGPVGLRMFNLGGVPASVTPPRTWRRAAWFMIFSSAAALIGLVFVATALVGPVQVADRVSPLPNLPAGPVIVDSTTSQPAPHSHDPVSRRRPDDPTDSATLPLTVLGEGAAPTPVPGTGSGVPASSGSGVGSSPVTVVSSRTGVVGPPAGQVVAPAPSPPLTTVTGSGPPGTDPGTLANRTQTFFKEVTTNVAAAADLTAGTVRDDAQAIITQRYGQISSIQVQSIALDPNSGVTISLLRVVNKDGSTANQQTTLHFTLGTDPKIENPGG